MENTKHKLKRKMIRIEARLLRIHPSAQRDLVPSKLKRLIENLDLDALGVLQAIECSIDGVHALWIIDGHHRVEALIARGLGEWPVDVLVHLDVQSPARASEVFLKLNDRVPVHPYDKFVNRVRAMDDIAVGVLKSVEDRRLTIDRSAGDGRLCCVNALMSLYSIDSGVSLNKTLDTVISAWGRDAATLEGKLIFGIGLLYKTYDGSIDTPALVKKLSKYPGGASAVIGDAKGIMRHHKRTLPRCIAEIVIDAYNVGRRTGKLNPL